MCVDLSSRRSAKATDNNGDKEGGKQFTRTRATRRGEGDTKPFELVLRRVNDTFTYKYTHGVNEKSIDVEYTLHMLTVPLENDVLFDNPQMSHYVTRALLVPDPFI
jgi:hypothetical protein